MNWQLLLPLLVTTAVAIVGWYIAHALAASRDRAKKQRDLRVEYLIEAYRRLEGSSNRDEDTSKSSDLESALADIQLLGSLGQINLARKLAMDLVVDNTAKADELLADLRAELREELQISKASGEVVYLRIPRGNRTVSNIAMQTDGASRRL